MQAAYFKRHDDERSPVMRRAEKNSSLYYIYIYTLLLYVLYTRRRLYFRRTAHPYNIIIVPYAASTLAREKGPAHTQIALFSKFD